MKFKLNKIAHVGGTGGALRRGLVVLFGEVQCIMGNDHMTLPPVDRMTDRHEGKRLLPATSLTDGKYVYDNFVFPGVPWRRDADRLRCGLQTRTELRHLHETGGEGGAAEETGEYRVKGHLH